MTESTLITSLKGAWKTKKNKDWDSCNVPALVTIRGWVDDTVPQAYGVKMWRIYLNHSMTRYYEVADEHVIYRQPIDGDADSPDRVWLEQGARVRLVTMQSRTAEVTAPPLLSGPIVQGYLPAAATAPAPQVVGTVPLAASGPSPYGLGDGGEYGGWETSNCTGICFSHSP